MSSCICFNSSANFDLIGLQIMAFVSHAHIIMMQSHPRMDFIGNFPVWSVWILFSGSYVVVQVSLCFLSDFSFGGVSRLVLCGG